MKTDSFFYRFFSKFPGAFFILIGKDERKAEHYQFISVEVKEQAFRFDGIFLPETVDDEIYFVEVQFSHDTDFYSRFFAEIFLYLRQHHPANDWRAVVLFPHEAFDPGLNRHYREFFESGRLQRIYLNQLPATHFDEFPLNLLQIISAPEQNILATVTKITQQLPAEIQDEKERETIIDLLINLLMNKLPQLTREEIQKMVEPMLSDIKKSRAYQEIMQEGKQEGEYKRTREIAKAMLQKNMNFELIAELTGLSQQELLAITQELAEHKN